MGTKQERHFFRVRERPSDGLRFLVPDARLDAEYVAHLQPGSLVEVTVHKGRSRPRHRLYWASLHLVVENSDTMTSAEALHKLLLIGCGVVEPLATLEGEIVMLPSSTAFAAMDEAAFQDYFNHAMRLITTHILPGVDLHALLDEARERAGERHGSG